MTSGSTTSPPHTRPRILLCACAGGECLSDEKRRELRTVTPDGGEYEVEWVPDLCRVAARKPERLRNWANQGESLTVVGCFPRTIHALFEWAGVEDPAGKIEVRNHRNLSTDEALRDLGASRGDRDAVGETPESNDEWVPWFPVIDPDRCVDCKQCMNFCLFGVYAEDETGRVRVENPDACKTNCPACARVCPQAAIIFPKYAHSPINGAEVGELGSEKEKIQVDMDELIQGNVHAALAARKFKRRRMALTRKEQAKTP